MSRYDYVIVGAGPTGATFAQCAADVLGARVLVTERRGHVAGNCHDTTFADSGLIVHSYGPHYLRFTDEHIFGYVSRFTRWIPGNYIVKADVGGVLVPMPINLDTLELLLDVEPLNAASAAKLLDRERTAIDAPSNSEELVVSRVGRRLFELLYDGYTRKQWGRPAKELDPTVCGRIPVRFDRNPFYVDAPWQVMPADGYTALFTRMLDHPNIDVAVDVDWLADPVHGSAATIFTGPVDEFFGEQLGQLQWRSLRFEHQVHDQEWFQPCVQVNFPGPEPHTRRVEIKHVTRQRSPRTVVTHEYPADEGEKFYPVPSPHSKALYAGYAQLAQAETALRGVHFAGRLARYMYINTDEAIAAALALFSELTGRDWR